MFHAPAHKSGSAAQIVNPLPAELAQPAAPSIESQVQALYAKPLYEIKPVRDVPKGEYIRRLNAYGPNQKVYKRGAYDRSTRKYELIDCDDINRTFWLAGHALVAIGFTY